MRYRSLQMYVAVALVMIATSAFADRAPGPEERARIEAALQAQGFIRWGEIERDDGLWEVDDAIASDGQEYDLKLDDALKIIKRERD